MDAQIIRLSDHRPMWQHYCPQERTWLSVGHNEPCNWCGAIELADPDQYDHYGEGD